MISYNGYVQNENNNNPLFAWSFDSSTIEKLQREKRNEKTVTVSVSAGSLRLTVK